MRPVLRALARQFDPLSDAALLERYARDRDPAAFEVLVWRHGPVVLGVCRRHLRDAHAAEDALQATFLILARQAAGVRGDTLPGFLHRVARRVAVRAAAKTRRRRETPLDAEPAARPSPDSELASVLDAEIDRLPDRLRQVVVLCYLDGRSTADAAARLGVPRGTVLSRLATARAKLAGRLTRRGVTPPAVGLTTILTAEAVSACVRLCEPGGLCARTGAASILANEVLAMSVRKTVLAVAAGLVLAGGAGTGVGVLTAQSGGPPAAGKVGSPAARPVAQKDAGKDTADDRIVRLRRAEGEVRTRIVVVMARERDINRQVGSQVDVAALQNRLAALDVEILAAEDTVADKRAKFDEAVKAAAGADTEPLYEDEIKRLLANDPVLQGLQARKQQLSATGRVGPRRAEPKKSDADKAKDEAEAKLRPKEQADEIAKEIETRSAQLRPEVEKKARADLVQSHKDWVSQQTAGVDTAAAHLKRLEAGRKKLVDRIDDQRRLSDERRLAEDEARVYRELLQAVVRQRAQAELGIEVPAAAQSAASASDDRFDQLARQLAELRHATVTADGTSRIDLLDRKLDELRQAVQSIKR